MDIYHILLGLACLGLIALLGKQHQRAERAENSFEAPDAKSVLKRMRDGEVQS